MKHLFKNIHFKKEGRIFVWDINPTPAGSQVKTTNLQLMFYNPFNRKTYKYRWFRKWQMGNGAFGIHLAGIRILFCKHYYYCFPHLVKHLTKSN